MRRAMALFLALAMSACQFGPRLYQVPVAHSPSGVFGAFVTVSRTTFYGELLSVQDTGLVVVRANAVTFVPWHVLAKASFDFPKVTLTRGEAPSAEQRAQLITVSRYPQGLKPELEQRLLAAYGQTSIFELRQ